MNKQDLTGFTASDLQPLDGQKMLLCMSIQSSEFNQWLEGNAQHLLRLMQENGALLIRPLPINGSKKLERVLSTIFAEPMLEYNFRSTPRTKMRGKIYTSSEYHLDETIPLHNENAYCNEWAMKIAFYCAKPSETGGATPIADSHKVYQGIDQAVKDKFEQKGLLYVRNYGDIDLTWTDVFQTDNKDEVSAYCEKNGIDYQWHGKNELRTRQVTKAAYAHPITGDNIWFNQAHLFHISNLEEQTRLGLLETFDKDNLPRNVYYGDGEEIEVEALEHIRQVYKDNQVVFDWQTGDLMLLDNMRFAHGRLPFGGTRRVLVGMAGPTGAAQMQQ